MANANLPSGNPSVNTIDQPTLREGWICTSTGRRIYYGQMRDQNVYTVEDIAAALSNLCRFAGHCPAFYSVAQHSVIVAYQVLLRTGCAATALAALMHDAAEAYMVDIPRPLKRMLPEYRAIEREITAHIFRQHGLAYPYNELIGRVDNEVLATEARDFGMNDRGDWNLPDAIDGLRITPIPSAEARAQFIEKHHNLTEAVKAATPKEPRSHTFYSCPPGCDKPHCQYCHGGLAYCTTCHGGEASLPTECPGRPMSPTAAAAVLAGRMDYVNGAWCAASAEGGQ